MPQTNGGDSRLQDLLGVSPSVVDAAIAGNRASIEEIRQSATAMYVAPAGTPAPAYRNRVGTSLPRVGRAQWFNVEATWDALSNVANRAAFTAEALTDALEPPTPEPNLPEREPRSYPLLPAEQVLSTSNLTLEDELDIDEEDDGPDPAHMYRYGVEPPRMAWRMRREPPTEEELESLRAFADQWSSLSAWGIQQGFLTINPRDLHEGAYIPQRGRLSEYYEYEAAVDPAPPRVNMSGNYTIDPFEVVR